MPSNHVLINNTMEYTVPDSKMDDFLWWLDGNGYAVDTGIKYRSDETKEDPVKKLEKEFHDFQKEWKNFLTNDFNHLVENVGALTLNVGALTSNVSVLIKQNGEQHDEMKRDIGTMLENEGEMKRTMVTGIETTKLIVKLLKREH